MKLTLIHAEYPIPVDDLSQGFDVAGQVLKDVDGDVEHAFAGYAEVNPNLCPDLETDNLEDKCLAIPGGGDEFKLLLNVLARSTVYSLSLA